MKKKSKLKREQPFKENIFVAEFTDLIGKNQHEKALGYLIDRLPGLLASGMNRKEKLNHLLFTSRLVQNGGSPKHGSYKLLTKAKSASRVMERHGLKQRDLYVDFGAGAHDPIALSTYFYVNGFERVVANDMLPPRNMTYSALSMRDILVDMHARPETFLLPDSDPNLFQKRLREFDTEEFGNGNFYEGFAGTEGRVSYVVDDIVNAGIEPGAISFITSFAVFEHVSDMKGVLDYLFKQTAPGGLGFHYIDLADHRSYRADGTYNAFSFLTEKDAPPNINRLRKSEQMEAFADAGFAILHVDSKTTDIPEDTLNSFLPKWANMSEDDQTTFSLTLNVEKPFGSKRSAKKPTVTTTKIPTEKPEAVGQEESTETRKADGGKLKGQPADSTLPGLQRSELGWLQEHRARMPDSFKKHPARMSLIEREVLYGIASEYYEGKGVIVDTGAFLGASTRIIGNGIRANPKKSEILGKYKKPCLTFESAKLEKGTMEFFERQGVETDLVEGTSFAKLLRKLIKDVRPLIDLRIGNILKQKAEKEPIEILMLDAVKSPEINAYVFKNFFPRLIPGKSIVIQQDYFVDGFPHLKISQEILAPYFEYIGNAQSSGYFLLKKKIPAKALNMAIGSGAENFESKISLIESCADRVSFDSDRNYLVQLSKISQTLKDKGYDVATSALGLLNEKFPEQAELQTESKIRLKRAVRLVQAELKQSKTQAKLKQSKAQAELKQSKAQAKLKQSKAQAKLKQSKTQAELKQSKTQAKLKQSKIQKE